MYTSFHVAFVPIPQSDRHLLFQTLKGAVDLVPEEVATALKAGSHDSFSDQEIETLTQRGYITDQPPEQEQEQARAVLRLAARNFRPGVEIVFRFSAGDRSQSPALAEFEKIEEVFSLAASLDQPVSVAIEIATSEIDEQALERIISKTIERDYPLTPTVTPLGLEAVRPWLKSQNFHFVMIETDSSNMPDDAADLSDAIVGCFERQVQVGWKCNVDDMTPAQCATVSEVNRRVREKYLYFMTSIVSAAADGTQEPGYIASNGSLVPYISADNDVILKTLFRFITTPRQINYNPFFYPDPSRLVFEVGANQLSYDSPERGTLEGFEAVRRAIKLEQPARLEPIAESVSECFSCKYSLVCGRDWIKRYSYKDANQCAGLFEQRVRQVLPLLLYNARGNVRPPGATGKKA